MLKVGEERVEVRKNLLLLYRAGDQVSINLADCNNTAGGLPCRSAARTVRFARDSPLFLEGCCPSVRARPAATEGESRACFRAGSLAKRPGKSARCSHQLRPGELSAPESPRCRPASGTVRMSSGAHWRRAETTVTRTFQHRRSHRAGRVWLVTRPIHSPNPSM